MPEISLAVMARQSAIGQCLRKRVLQRGGVQAERLVCPEQLPRHLIARASDLSIKASARGIPTCAVQYSDSTATDPFAREVGSHLVDIERSGLPSVRQRLTIHVDINRVAKSFHERPGLSEHPSELDLIRSLAHVLPLSSHSCSVPGPTRRAQARIGGSGVSEHPSMAPRSVVVCGSFWYAASAHWSSGS
jgi:hypothetical protein